MTTFGFEEFRAALADLHDNELHALAEGIGEVSETSAEHSDDRIGGFWDALLLALIDERQRRRDLFAALEADLGSVDGAGAIVDSVADAITQAREEMRRNVGTDR